MGAFGTEEGVPSLVFVLSSHGDFFYAALNSVFF